MKLIALAAIGGLMLATGCVSTPIPGHEASAKLVKLIKESCTTPIALGDFTASDTPQTIIDQSVSARGLQLSSPIDNSFASYLKEALSIELRTAGCHDSRSPFVLSAQLTQNSLSAGGLSQGKAILAAKFQLQHKGGVTYAKETQVDVLWKSYFDGTMAIREATAQYVNLYSVLIAKLFGDGEFQSALIVDVSVSRVEKTNGD